MVARVETGARAEEDRAAESTSPDAPPRGHGRPLRDIFTDVAAEVAARTGSGPVPVVSVPPPAHAEPTDLQNVEVDSSAFRAVTGWTARTPFSDGIARTVTALTPVQAP